MSSYQLLLNGGLFFQDVLAAQADPPAREVVMNGETPVPNPIVVIMSSLVLLAMLRWLGKNISVFKKVDDFGRIVVAVLGILIPFSRLPIIQDLFSIGSTLIKAGTDNTNVQGWAFAGFSVVVIALGAIGAWMFFSKGTTKNAFIFAGLSGFLFLGLPWIQTAADWYINNVAIGFLWAMFMGIYRFARDHHISFS